MARVLICTDDPQLFDELLRLAAAASFEVDVARDPLGARAHWTTAAAVLIGGDVAEWFAATPLPRRPRVVVVGIDLDDAGVWQRAMESGSDRVVFLPDGDSWLLEFLADAHDASAVSAPVIAVVGGRGGAGASTLASALAVTALRRDISVLLVDADPLGGGLDLAIGGEDTAGLRWSDLATTRGRVSPGALAGALPRVNDLTLLSWDRGGPLRIDPDAIGAVLRAARGDSELVVVDLPRFFDAAACAVLEECTTCLLVVPAEIRACAAACRVSYAIRAETSDVRLVVRGPSPSGLRAEQIAEAIGLPLEGFLRAEPGLAAASDRGDAPARTGRGPLAQFSRRFIDRELGVRAGRRAA